VTDFFGSVSSIQSTPDLNNTAGGSDSYDSFNSYDSRSAQEGDAGPTAVGTSFVGQELNSSNRSSSEGSHDGSCSAQDVSAAVAVGHVQSSPSSAVGHSVYVGMAAGVCTLFVACIVAARSSRLQPS
jgi:hypothetical protein